MPLDSLEAFESISAPQEFYVEAFDDNVWIRPLDLGEILQLDFSSENKADLTIPMIRLGVVKADGTPVFDGSQRSIEVIKKLPGMAAQEIATEVGRISGLAVESETDEAEKK